MKRPVLILILNMSLILTLPSLAKATGPDCYPGDYYNPAPKIEEPIQTSRLQDFPLGKPTAIQLNTSLNEFGYLNVKITSNASINKKNLEFTNNILKVEHAANLIVELKNLSKKHDRIPAKIKLTTKKFAEIDPYECESYTGRILYKCSLDIVIPKLEQFGSFKGRNLNKEVETANECEQYFAFVTELVSP